MHVIEERVQVIQEWVQVDAILRGAGASLPGGVQVEASHLEMGASGCKSSKNGCKWMQFIHERVIVIDDLVHVI
jgi:hypothetical protein